MTDGMRRVVPGNCLVGLVFLLVLCGLPLTALACEDLDSGASTSVGEFGQIAGTTTTPASVGFSDGVTEMTTTTVVTEGDSTTLVQPTSAPAESTSTTAPVSVRSTTLELGDMAQQLDPGLVQMDPGVVLQDPHLSVTPTRYEDTVGGFFRGGPPQSWITASSALFSGGTQIYSDVPNSYQQVYFTGTGVRLIAARAGNGGKLKVTLVGSGGVVKVETIQLHGMRADAYQQAVWYSGLLPEGEYVVSFMRDSDNEVGQPVWIDAIDCWGFAIPYPFVPDPFP